MQIALNSRWLVVALAVVWLGQYPVRLLAAYPIVRHSEGFGERPGSAQVLGVLTFVWTVAGGLFAVACVALSVAGLVVYVSRRQPMPTVFGRPGVALATLAIAILAMVSFTARPEVVGASWPTRAMEPLLSSIRALCESEGACPLTLEQQPIAPGIRTLAGRGWAYRSCGGKQFAVFFSQCWSSDCEMFRWSTDSCCSASTSSTLAIGGGWSALRADEDEAWIDRLCALDR